ncbi:MAG TPA: hypothetical protein VI168_10575 [Croceibacterium sp.]
MSRRNDISVLLALAALLTGTPAAAEPAPVDSWGRAGVDYDTYSNDSLECGLIGHYADISQTEQARMFERATRQLQSIDNSNYVPPGATPDQTAYAAAGQAQNYEQVRRSIRPDQRMKELKHGMVGLVEDCLRQRGYVKFRLTDDQCETLATFAKGSDERRHFLHGLGSSPQVLDAQALGPEAS